MMKEKKGLKKRLGQHLLRDEQIISEIIAFLQLKAKEHVIEIGPGFGALTQVLLKKVETVEVIEFDCDLIPFLKSMAETKDALIIHQADVLKVDFSTLKQDDRPLRIVGNLPYNISTPLLFHLIKFRDLIQDMHFMLQKEVGDRLAARPGSKIYGRLSVMIQYYFRVEHLLHVDAHSFEPSPKVDSSFINLVPYRELPYVAHDEQEFEIIVREAFNHRRKTIRNCLRVFRDEQQIVKAGVDPMKRPEVLSVKEFVDLCNVVK